MLRTITLGELDLFVVGRSLVALDGDATHTIEVPCFGPGSDMATFAARPGLRAMLGTFPGGERFVYLNDENDDRFGYAWNLDMPDYSD